LPGSDRTCDRRDRRVSVTDPVKGIVLLVIGLTKAARTFREDVARGRLRVGRGLLNHRC
jgi:hypothetical protein